MKRFLSMVAVLVLAGCGGSEGKGYLPDINTAPLANAGSAQTATVGNSVALDASASSDADGNTLTYLWTLTGRPSGSSAVLSSTTVQKPILIPDLAGTYTVQLVVNDGKTNSSAATVLITAWASTGKTKLDASGQPLADTATSWVCVRDNVSKLVWEVKTKDGGLRAWSRVYTNYSSDYNPNSLYNTSTDATGFAAAVNATGLCGGTDWRVPSESELLGLGQSNSAAPALDATYFQDVDGTVGGQGYFWTSTGLAGSTYANGARALNFNTPYVIGGSSMRYSLYSVRLVRTGS